MDASFDGDGGGGGGGGSGRGHSLMDALQGGGGAAAVRRGVGGDGDDDSESNGGGDGDGEDGRSDSTLSDWTDEEADEARAEGLGRGVAAAAAAARDAAAQRSGAKDRGSSGRDSTVAGDDPGFAWSGLGPGEPLPAGADDAWEWDDGGAGGGGRFRTGAGALVVAAASRLLPALSAARGGEGATLVDAAAAAGVGVGVGGGLEGQTEAKVVGAALHALQGVAPVCRRPAAVPHLSPSALAAALERAADAAATLQWVHAAAVAVLDTPAPAAAYAAAAARGRHPPRLLLLPSAAAAEQSSSSSGAGKGKGMVGPSVRAFAAALAQHVRELREELAPLLQRAAGIRGGDVGGVAARGGAPTLLELRVAMRSVALRSRVLHSLAVAGLPPSSAHLTPAAAASRCLTAMYRAAATHQATASAGGDALVSGEITGDWGHTNVGDIGGGGEVAGGPGTGAEARVGVGVGGDGFVTALRLLCSAAQPYLAALHRWLDVGELSDPSGELFVAAGSAAAADVGTEAHWDKGFMLRRRPSRLIQSPTSTSTPTSLGEVECPEFFAGCAEELMAAGKSVQLLRHNRGGWSDAAREDVNENGEVGETWGDHWRGRVNQDNRSGRDKRSGRSSRGGVQPENGGSSGSTEDDGEVATAAVPEMSHHLCVEFCEGIRIAIEPLSTAPPAAVAIAEAGGAGEVGIDDWGPGWHRDSEADESFRLLSGMSLEACPPHPDAAVAHATAATGASAAWEETCALLAAGLTGSSTRVAPFVGEWLEWGGGPFERPPALAAAAALDAWLAASTAARSPATCPVAALLVRSAVAPARRRATAVAAALMARLRGEWRLQRSLAALRAVYLGGAGEATAVFSAAVFARLDQYGAAPTPGPAAGTMADVGDRSGEWAVWSDPSELSAALAEALTMDDSGELPDPRDVSVEIVSRSPDNPPGQRRRPSAARGGDGESEAGGSGGGGGTSAATAVAEEDRNQLGEGTVQLEALSSLRLSLRIPWPLTLVIPESCLERYNAAAVFLLQVRRARAALEEVVRSGWSAAARRTPGGGGGGGPHARGLAAELRHFVAALHEHVVARVLHSAWQELVAEVDKADSPGAARDAHAAFLDAAARQCLVSPDPTWTLLAAQVRAALAIACDFAAAHRRAAAAAAAAAADADPEVGMRLVGPAAAASPEAALEAAALLGYRPVPEDEAERLATAFRRARSYVLRVVESKLRLGTFPELAELRMRLDFNGFYGTDEDSGGGGGRGGGGCVYAAHRSDIHH